MGSKYSTAYRSKKTLARHKRRIAKHLHRLEAADRLACSTIQRLKERIRYLEAKIKAIGK